MTAASALLREVRGVGLSVRLDGGRLLAAANSPPELLARLRAHKAEIIEILKADRCCWCGEPLRWPGPAGVVLGDGLAECMPCVDRQVGRVSGAADLVPLVPPDEPAAPSWVDDRAWCARLGAAGAVERRRVVLCEWVEAAGGWHDAAAVHLPDCLPNNLARATLKAHARLLGLAVRDDPDDPELLAWLMGGR